MNTTAFDEALNDAISAISNLKAEAEELRDSLDSVIEACNTIEDEL